MSHRKVKLLLGVVAEDVRCPYCAQPAGSLCRIGTSIWDAPEPHAARIKLANDRDEASRS